MSEKAQHYPTEVPELREPPDKSSLIPSWRDAGVLQTVFQDLFEAVILYDDNLVLTGINPAAERLLGMNAVSVVGKRCQEVFACPACDRECGLIQSLQGLGSTPHCTVHMHVSPTRERLAVLTTRRLLDEEGHSFGAMAVISNVTNEVPSQNLEVVAESASMREVLNFVRRVAASETTTILIEGENGTGKDLIAKLLHYQSPRRDGPFIAINCAAIPETLLESELFGYERGAFTDAKSQKKGLIELADGGTLFLDEIGEIPLVLQAKLLRVLEEQQIRRLGGLKDIDVNIRVVAATNKDLREAVKEQAFRQDLYFRLNVIQFTIPPLRERRDDILPTTQFFINHYNRKFKRGIQGISPEAAKLLLAHNWPGNVRELRNAVERAMILEESSLLTVQNLPIAITDTESFQPAAAPLAAPGTGPTMSWKETERSLLLSALRRSGGNQTRAAILLGITRDKLRYQMKKFGVGRDSDTPPPSV